MPRISSVFSKAYLRGPVFCLAALFTAAGLCGCIKSLAEGDRNSTLLRPEIIKVTVATEKVKPAAPPATPTPTPVPPAAPPAPPVPEKLLPQDLPACDTLGLPSNRPESPKVSEKPADFNAGLYVRKPSRFDKDPDLYYKDRTLTEDTTWQGDVLVEGTLTVAPQTTLSIEPGTTVRFRPSAGEGGGEAALLVQGRILATGSADRPVLFTSDGKNPAPGDWQGIVILGSSKKNLLENCRIEGAETGVDASFSTLTIRNTTVTNGITGLQFSDSLITATGGGVSKNGTGLILADSEGSFTSIEVSQNRLGIAATDGSLYLDGSRIADNAAEGVNARNVRMKIAGSAFSGNGSGIVLSGGEGEISSCLIASGTGVGIHSSGSRIKVTGNDIRGNAGGGIRADDGRGSYWGNSFAKNGSCDFFNTGKGEVRAMGNWWGAEDDAAIEKRICDGRSAKGKGRVRFTPALKKPPLLAVQQLSGR